MPVDTIVNFYNQATLKSLTANAGIEMFVGEGLELSASLQRDYHSPRTHFCVQLGNGHGVSATFMHAVEGGELKPASMIWNGQGYSDLEKMVTAFKGYLEASRP